MNGIKLAKILIWYMGFQHVLTPHGHFNSENDDSALVLGPALIPYCQTNHMDRYGRIKRGTESVWFIQSILADTSMLF